MNKKEKEYKLNIKNEQQLFDIFKENNLTIDNLKQKENSIDFEIEVESEEEFIKILKKVMKRNE